MKRQHEAAMRRVERARDAIYKTQKRTDIPFYECFRLAPQALRDKWQAANGKRDAIEMEAISKGKAYRTSYGFFWSK